jgi:hypothetical protein
MSNPLFQRNHFDFELEILYFCMMCVVFKILAPFLEFCKRIYNEGTQHACSYIGFMVQRLVMFVRICYLGKYFNDGARL